MSQTRGLHIMGSYLYAVIGSILYKVDVNGNSLKMNGTLSTTSGKVWMENNGTQLMITDGTYGYILSGVTLTKITDTDFPTPSSLTYQDGYFIVSKDSTGRFYISTSYDGTTWDATDYATAEGDPDNLQCIISAHRELWLLGKTSYEVWYNSGESTFPFSRIEGSFNRIGCIAPASACKHMGVICWLDDNRYTRSSSGYNAVKISTSQIDYQISQYSTVSDAIGFMYSQEGHTFYILSFPTEAKTWCYDFNTQLWHTRATDTTDTMHRVTCYAFFEGMHIVGDHENGKLYKYDLAKYSDNGITLRRRRSAQAITADRKNLFHHALEIEFEGGVGLSVNDPDIASGTDPQAMLDWSDDGGHTWSNEHWTDMGAIGEYTTRAKWRKLGRSRDRIYRVTISDPVKCVMIGAHLEANLGVS